MLQLDFSVAYFNSIKVRLKQGLANNLVRALRFQFHKGTIKTFEVGVQFIKLSYFNSIKVRLKLGNTAPALFKYRFQFHKGTIKTSMTDARYGSGNVFQFHKGTIKTDTKGFAAQMERYFNSIKVRLKRKLNRNYPRDGTFQFHKGTIKTNVSGGNTFGVGNFNSIKVRLKQYGR